MNRLLRLRRCRLMVLAVAGWAGVFAGGQVVSAADAAMPAAAPAAKTLIDYFLPMPLQGPLTKDVWGAPGVLPRDVDNGLEDHHMMKDYCYWDGKILKGNDGKYHMFASRWDQAKGHNGWGSSVAVHAVSDSLYGPYVDKGMCWPDNKAGRGHNVTALQLPDGRYAIIVSETRPSGDIFVSDSLDGPWTQLGSMKVPEEPRWRASNVSMILRPDGDFEFVARSGVPYISKAADGILGPYHRAAPTTFPKGIPDLEDPVIWYSGGLYHITVNSWSTRKAYHLTSVDGTTHWINRGLAYNPDADFLRYPDGTINHWNKIERPGVYIEDGHVKAFTFAVIDVPKDQDKGNDGHGSKVIVVPFDGVRFDDDLKNAAGRGTP